MSWREREAEKLKRMWPGITEQGIAAAMIQRPIEFPPKKPHGNRGQPKPQKIFAKAQRAKSEASPDLLEAQLPIISQKAWDALPGSSPVPLEQRTGCKWPIGQHSPFLFCNAPTGEKGRYCPHHEERSRSKV